MTELHFCYANHVLYEVASSLFFAASGFAALKVMIAAGDRYLDTVPILVFFLAFLLVAIVSLTLLNLGFHYLIRCLIERQGILRLYESEAEIIRGRRMMRFAYTQVKVSTASFYSGQAIDKFNGKRVLVVGPYYNKYTIQTGDGDQFLKISGSVREAWNKAGGLRSAWSAGKPYLSVDEAMNALQVQLSSGSGDISPNQVHNARR